MNKIYKILFLVACTILGNGCISYDTATQPITVRIQVIMPDNFNENTAYAGHTVTLGDQTTDENGIATFKNIIPDIYTISTSTEITAEEYRTYTGSTDVQNINYLIAGSLSNTLLATDNTIKLSTNVSARQSLVISKIYYSGTKDKNNKNYLAAKYIELYNNSDQPVILSDYYIGLIESESSPAYPLAATPDYLYLKQIYKFPGSATSLQPGTTIVIANSAINHSENNDIDLTLADYEAKYDGKGGFVNNPDIPAIEPIYSYITNTSMNLIQSGPCSIVLFRTDKDVTSWPTVYKLGASRGNKYIQIPIQYVVDGVECLKYTTNGIETTNKRLYDYIDAGYTNITATSGYSGEVIYRKIQKVENGRTILLDTNNSTVDFGISQTILPRMFKE